MNNLFIAFLVFTMGAQMQTQDKLEPGMDKAKLSRTMALMGQKIEMDADTILLTSMSTNTYEAENLKAVVMVMMVPETYAKAREQ